MTSRTLHDPGASYYQHTRLELVSMLEKTPETALEIGCGSGNTLQYLKQQGTHQTFGIELNGAVAQDAVKHVDHVAEGDIESLQWPFPGQMFDCIIIGDVLEHLRDPWGLVATLSSSLNSRGEVVASLPNVRFYGVSIPLLIGGRWTYTEQGVLDRTHLRFFTKRTATELFSSAGLEISRVASIYGPKRRLVNIGTLGVFRNLLARQHLVHARKH